MPRRPEAGIGERVGDAIGTAQAAEIKRPRSDAEMARGFQASRDVLPQLREVLGGAAYLALEKSLNDLERLSQVKPELRAVISLELGRVQVMPGNIEMAAAAGGASNSARLAAARAVEQWLPVAKGLLERGGGHVRE